MSARDVQADTWVATDALGRSLPTFAEVGPPHRDRFVGIFYFIWLGGPLHEPIHDLSRIRAEQPDHPQFGPERHFHWWGKPRLGHYRSDDPFVIRKHAQMLTDAGVDVIFIDVTNGITYDANLRALCDTYLQIRREGGRTPSISFVTHAGARHVIEHLHRTFYKAQQYDELWFRWLGKPLILADPAAVPDDLRGVYTLRESWAWTRGQSWFGDGRDKWPWLDHTPQQPGWHVNPQTPEQISVAVAEHPVSDIGRSYHDGHEPAPGERDSGRGLFFAEQWKRALAVHPPMVFVTGWNEWVAQRFIKHGGGPATMAGRPLSEDDSYFVDEYSPEFSRDIEPMSGGFGDNFYYQLVAAVRRYKGARPIPHAGPMRTIPEGGGFDAWRDVTPTYYDDLYDTPHRDHDGAGGDLHEMNDSGRNDFDVMKVARDADHVYFYVRTRQPITPPGGANWMTLLINADRDAATGWCGYDYVINRLAPDHGEAIVERHDSDAAGGAWAWRTIGKVHYQMVGNEMQIAVPRKLIGLDRAAGKLTFDFKWTDNLPAKPTAMDFIDQGDVAPNGRFAYRFTE